LTLWLRESPRRNPDVGDLTLTPPSEDLLLLATLAEKTNIVT